MPVTFVLKLKPVVLHFTIVFYSLIFSIGELSWRAVSIKKLRRNYQELHLVLFIALATVDIALVIFFATPAAVMLPFVILAPLAVDILPCAFVVLTLQSTTDTIAVNRIAAVITNVVCLRKIYVSFLYNSGWIRSSISVLVFYSYWYTTTKISIGIKHLAPTLDITGIEQSWCLTMLVCIKL